MNISLLEKVARQALKGESIAAKSSALLRDGELSIAEHRSLRSLSLQITANVRTANGATGGTLAFDHGVERIWL